MYLLYGVKHGLHMERGNAIEMMLGTDVHGSQNAFWGLSGEGILGGG